MSSQKNKPVKIYGELKEVASFCGEVPYFDFGLPAEENRQRDLQYITAVFVSSGMNLNGGYFLPSELISARDTIVGKALDVEHLEEYIVGSIYERAFMTKDKQVIDPVDFLVEYGTSVDRQQIDIAVLMGLYKYRFPQVAEEVSSGKYKVSMECYYKDFDLKIGDIIVSKDEAAVMGIEHSSTEDVVGRNVKLVEGEKEIGFARIGRVFRDILFTGCGLTEIPANLESDILETASSEENDEILEGVEIDLTKSETYMKDRVEREKIEVSSSREEEKKDDAMEEDKKDKEIATGAPSSTNPGTCLHFKKYVYEYQPPVEEATDPEGEVQPQLPKVPGVGDNPGPDDKVVGEHWCNLFDTKCTVLAGDATDARCLRNVLNRTAAEAIDNAMRLHQHLKWDSPIADKLRKSLLQADEILNTFKPQV